MADDTQRPDGDGNSGEHGGHEDWGVVDVKPLEPPTGFFETLKRLGPGMIIAGSIVGSGELIATTKVGAEAGFYLLWLIIIGCVIKVFCQIEFGRYTVTHAQTPLKALDTVPGPRAKVNWLVWVWVVVAVLVLSQQGGIVGAIGQAMMMSRPLTEYGEKYNEMQDELVRTQVVISRIKTRFGEHVAKGATTDKSLNEIKDDEVIEIGKGLVNDSKVSSVRELHAGLVAHQAKVKGEVAGMAKKNKGDPMDAHLWAGILSVVTSIILYFGRYGLIQIFSTILVVGFTIGTIGTLIWLQLKPEWAVTGEEIARGMSFRLPPAIEEAAANPLMTALGAFGIIGVGGMELIMYPYWCLEKGYAKFTGPCDKSEAWYKRANGWMRVMRMDAWSSMAVYTLATIAFFLLGAAVLGRTGLNPEGKDLVRTLSEMYVPVFGVYASDMFLVGAFAVLYSTFFVNAAGLGRMIGDACGLFGWHDESEAARMRWTHWLCVGWPIAAFLVYMFVQAPVAMVVASGVSQSIMLPMLAGAALYFRYKRCDRPLQPGRLWDGFLWLSMFGLLVAGGVAFYKSVGKLF